MIGIRIAYHVPYSYCIVNSVILYDWYSSMSANLLWEILDPAEYLAQWIAFDVRALRMVITLILSSIGAIVYHGYFWDADYEIHAEQSFDRHLALFAIGFTLGFYNYGFRYTLTDHLLENLCVSTAYFGPS